MSEEHPSPFPTALILDTSFLRTIGDRILLVSNIHTIRQRGGSDLYLTPGVVEELAEQRGYISIDWVDRADTTAWINLIDTVQPGFGSTTGRVLGRSWIGFMSDWRSLSRQIQTS